METLKEQIKNFPYMILGKINGLSYKLINTLSWELLRDIEHNKIVKSTYVWLFIVPICAKLLSEFEDKLSFHIGDKLVTIDLVLPFSWQALFFSACFFVAGNILVMLLIPSMIKQYKGFSDYSESGKTMQQLKTYHYSLQEPEKLDKIRKLAGIESNYSEAEAEAEAVFKKQFWDIYFSFSYQNIILRGLCSLLYLTAILFIVDVAYKNLIWVLSSMNIQEFKGKLFFEPLIDFVINIF